MTDSRRDFTPMLRIWDTYPILTKFKSVQESRLLVPDDLHRRHSREPRLTSCAGHRKEAPRSWGTNRSPAYEKALQYFHGETT